MKNRRKIIGNALALTGYALAGLFLWVYLRPMPTFRPGQTRIALAEMASVVDGFEVDSGHFPDSLDEVAGAWSNRGTGSPRPACTNFSMDEWGQAMRYRRTSKGYEIRSAGRDGKFDTNDDIWR